jgi:ureidoacrylate peracid hydrolase
MRDAMFRDYVCLLLADCTAEPGVADMSHEASLRVLQHQFGWVAQSAQFIAALERQYVPPAA